MANYAEALLEMSDLERQTRLLPSSGGLEEQTEETLKENRARTVSVWTLPGTIGDGLAKGAAQVWRVYVGCKEEGQGQGRGWQGPGHGRCDVVSGCITAEPVSKPPGRLITTDSCALSFSFRGWKVGPQMHF